MADLRYWKLASYLIMGMRILKNEALLKFKFKKAIKVLIIWEGNLSISVSFPFWSCQQRFVNFAPCTFFWFAHVHHGSWTINFFQCWKGNVRQIGRTKAKNLIALYQNKIPLNPGGSECPSLVKSPHSDLLPENSSNSFLPISPQHQAFHFIVSLRSSLNILFCKDKEEQPPLLLKYQESWWLLKSLTFEYLFSTKF